MASSIPAVGLMSINQRQNGGPPSARGMGYQNQVSGPDQRFNTPIGPSFLYTAANWGGKSVYLEVYMRSTSSKAQVQLYDVTAGAAVANSLISVDAVYTSARQRSGALSLADGHEYQIQLGQQDAGAGAIRGAKLVII